MFWKYIVYNGFAYALPSCQTGQMGHDGTHFSPDCLKVFPASGFIATQQGHDTCPAGLIQPTDTKAYRCVDFPNILDSYQLAQ